ncbi:hypothetical protein PHLGIDRAFT_17705 [Phlebiopsis gigantea 11061_1 CR5-6]|uniref:Replication factor A protein 3 n=1 Tax=Phlebiopsis gigantea (strain 11061_1 CR5-6) TaxID=745531 RepID=A0A0C3SE22_PHLG1|nr:hypothetical protein PHLGIDRAFT_17705 [Phlebiopsis gigantea 11061_1 CR5-6]
MADFTSPLVNSARLPDYQNKTVRLPCEVIRSDPNANEVVVKASDGGQVRVKLVGGVTMKKGFFEVVGNVVNNEAIKAHAIIDLGENLDLSLVDFVVEKSRDPQFSNIF